MQIGQVKARQVEIWTQKVLALGAPSPCLFVWWISVRVVTANLLNEKLVQDFGFDLFCLCQGGGKSSHEINLNLWTRFLNWHLLLTFVWLLRSWVYPSRSCEDMYFLLSIQLCLIPHLPWALASLLLHILIPCYLCHYLFVFSLCFCLVSFAHCCLCFVSLTAKACNLQGLSIVWICLFKRGPRSQQSTQRSIKTNHPKQDRQENIHWIFLCAHK